MLLTHVVSLITFDSLVNKVDLVYRTKKIFEKCLCWNVTQDYWGEENSHSVLSVFESGWQLFLLGLIDFLLAFFMANDHRSSIHTWPHQRETSTIWQIDRLKVTTLCMQRESGNNRLVVSNNKRRPATGGWSSFNPILFVSFPQEKQKKECMNLLRSCLSGLSRLPSLTLFPVVVECLFYFYLHRPLASVIKRGSPIHVALRPSECHFPSIYFWSWHIFAAAPFSFFFFSDEFLIYFFASPGQLPSSIRQSLLDAYDPIW